MNRLKFMEKNGCFVGVKRWNERAVINRERADYVKSLIYVLYGNVLLWGGVIMKALLN